MNKDHSIIKVPSQEPSGVPVALNYDWGFKAATFYDNNDASTTMVSARIDQVLASQYFTFCKGSTNNWHGQVLAFSIAIPDTLAAGPVPSNKNNTYLLLIIQLTVVRSLVLEVQTKFDGDQQEPLKLWCSIIQMVCVWMFIDVHCLIVRSRSLTCYQC